MPLIPRLISLVTLSAIGCVVQSPPPADTTPAPAPRPAPKPQPTPQPTPEPDCDPRAAVIYEQIHRGGPGKQGAAKVTFTLRASGAWDVAGATSARRGCLSGDQLEHFEQALAGADFAPPPPGSTCDAVATDFAWARDVRRGRSAHWSSPCGTSANPDVTHLALQVRNIAGELQVPRPSQPEPPAHAHCSPTAPALYIEAVRSSPQLTDLIERITILTSGAWIHRSEHGPDKKGCASPRDLAAFRRALAATDFTPPPPPDIQCKAIPTRFTLYNDVQRQRKAGASSPCGRQPNPEVLRLSAMARKLVAGAQPRPPQAPVACRPGGKPLYDLRVSPIIRDQRAMVPPPTRTVTIYPTGYWTRTMNGARSSGCLGKPQLRTLKRAAAATKLQQTSSDIRCRALPTNQLTLTLRKGSYRWSSPCGADLPHDSVPRLMNTVDKMLGDK